MFTFIKDHELLSLLVTFSLLMFIASLVIIPIIISKLPRNYFSQDKRRLSKLHSYHPVVYLVLRLIKNLIGLLLVIAGIVMLVTPGQGILTLLIGLSLMDFPGKYNIERKIVRNTRVFKTLNWIRKKAGALPLEYPE